MWGVLALNTVGITVGTSHTTVSTPRGGGVLRFSRVVARGEELLQHPTILLPARQLAAALLAVDPAFSVDEYSSMEYGELRKLQGRFLLPRKEERTTAVEFQIRQNNVFKHHLPQRKECGSPRVVRRNPQVRGSNFVAVGIPHGVPQ